MLAALIVVPNLIAAGLLFWFLPVDYAWTCVVPLSIGVGAFIIRRGINEWWYAKFPPRLAEVECRILDKHFPYYRQLNEALKTEFERRVAVFRMLKLFQMRAIEKIPGDIQLLVSAYGVQLTMGFAYRREFYPRMTTIVLFPRTFISPEVNAQLHAVEVNRGKVFDCILLAINTLIDGLKNPREYYQTGIYGFAKAFRLERGDADCALPLGDNPQAAVESLCARRGFPQDYHRQFTGLAEAEPFELFAEQFFSYPETLRGAFPEVYARLVELFGQDPARRDNPVTGGR